MLTCHENILFLRLSRYLCLIVGIIRYKFDAITEKKKKKKKT